MVVRLNAFKYSLAYIIPLLVGIAFVSENWLWCWMPLIFSFGVIPTVELVVKPNPNNLSLAEKELTKDNKLYDWLLYLTVPMQYGFLVWFLFSINNAEAGYVFWGRSISFGLLCGILGINVAHELGHRRKRTERIMAKALLLTSLYSHFYIEHNYGHHKNVATREDAASARRNEPLYFFWIRSIIFSYIDAWSIQIKLLRKSRSTFLSIQNEMLIYTLLTIIGLSFIYFGFGWSGIFGFVIAAALGILLLETVNYIEHYGLQREKLSDTRYEKATPQHSWNSNHILGRIMLFELTRHSDHHANPYKKYQALEHHDESPQLPTGYPGMMLLSMLPPIFFWVVNPTIKRATSGSAR